MTHPNSPAPQRPRSAGTALPAASDQPLTGRRWLPWDDWTRLAERTADRPDMGTTAQVAASANGYGPRVVGRRVSS
ncbi:hypothetical protein ACFV42_48170 [Streptomyces solisilvae]|uniref:hypothetical protein n=1 Tax=Streptomyces malaysiensis TaxID=92644 RepID=UPI003693B6A9